jgi:hypothetical protein
MEKKLKDVEGLPASQTEKLLGKADDDPEEVAAA